MITREHIGIFGKMNAGKSSIMNLLTQQETSIVDSSPGTTADTKITLLEIHGLGPVKLFDTAGLDEKKTLGEKKKRKVISTLNESDLILLVIDINTNDMATEQELINLAREADKQLIIIFNLFGVDDAEMKVNEIQKKLPALKLYKNILINAVTPSCRTRLIDFIKQNYIPKNTKVELLPFIKPDEFYILNIPMDDETPAGRYLRPQLMCEEYITRHWAYPVSYRMNLNKARELNNIQEKERWNKFINSFNKKPKLIITDSQAMDIMKDWTPEDIQLTTFSIVMINFMSNGRLNEFVSGVRHLDNLRPNDKILIVEACNHSRIGEDIGTVQIPNYFKKQLPQVKIEHNFGREFQYNDHLSEYKLIIHCGGCMITPQKLSARIKYLLSLGVPFTNYGVFLSYIHGKHNLDRVLKIWDLRL